jgi:subtilisin family serine protease
VLRFEPEQGAAYYVMVRATGASAGNDASGRFHLVVLGAGLEVHNRHGSIPFPGDGPGVLAVGAVDATGCRSRYSSCGPNSSRPKPDFVALVPFPSLCRAEPFDGTSAAAPQAAGLAALLWARHPHWNAAAVNAALRATAEDLGPPGHDFETGHGLLNLNRRGTETQRRQEKNPLLFLSSLCPCASVVNQPRLQRRRTSAVPDSRDGQG